MTSFLSLSFNSPLIHRPQSASNFDNLCSFPTTLLRSSSYHSVSRSHIWFAFSPPGDSNYDRDEARWLREEQRWLREEQRWLREESRWNAERESLLLQIKSLQLRIEELGPQNSVSGGSMSEMVATFSELLQMLKEGELGKKVNRIAESGSIAVPLLEVAEEAVVKEVIQICEENTRKTLRKGSEGEEVRVMQEALLNLGYYSGEEDMEFYSFSSGTERAVKTWQAAIGVLENGIMTADLLKRLYEEQKIGNSNPTVKDDPKRNDNTIIPQKKSTNGAASHSMIETSEVQQKFVKEDSVEEVSTWQHRVFLLGENRWEEPARLGGASKLVDGVKRVDVTMCESCRGEGRLLCTECDGTGEPNVEPQFLEWVDEGTKCPYCEGLGYTICDMCDGKTVIQA